jgi:Na+:H+ antiporter, NhaB family
MGPNTLAEAFARNFLGRAPGWYKLAIVGFLIANPILLQMFGPIVTGWALLAEFIFTLAMALRCYPLQPGGLLALQAMLLGLTSPESVYAEVQQAFPVLLLLIFMVAGIYFLRDLLMFIFTKLVLRVRSQTLLALVFCATSALLSAFLDALTVVAVAMMVGLGFYQVYHRVASGKRLDAIHDESHDTEVRDLHRADLEGLRGFLRGLMMHSAVGTALGGVTTMVGEPQNLLIAEQADWNFRQFFLEVAPVSLPVLAAGLLTCVVVQRFRLFGYGEPLPATVRRVLEDYDAQQSAALGASERQVLIVQALVAVLLVLGLAFHLAAVGVVGLFVIVLATSFTGVIEEHRLGKAFETALPFTALLVVFFVIVAEIHDQHLFEGLIRNVLALDGKLQSAMMYAANGVLSAISDNVFVATIYITEIKAALLQGAITREQFDVLAVAVNTGTNIPSVATPNGQAAFLFLLTSTLAPLIRLGYLRMVWMALPYTIVMTTVGLLAVVYLL